MTKCSKMNNNRGVKGKGERCRKRVRKFCKGGGNGKVFRGGRDGKRKGLSGQHVRETTRKSHCRAGKGDRTRGALGRVL